jgi:hypothetical protein
MKYLIVLLILVGCTPQMTTDYASQGMQSDQRQQQLSAQRQGMTHAPRSSEMPIIVICNQVNSKGATCLKRSMPGSETSEIFGDR